MLIDKLKYRIYQNALRKLLKSGQKAHVQSISTNFAQTFLILFDGTDQHIRDYFLKTHANYPPHAIKLMAFVSVDKDVQGFNMALYNKKDVKWDFIPKDSILELVQANASDMLIHINPDNYPHLHYLAVAANAKFKVSTLSEYPNDFNLTVHHKPTDNPQQIYIQMMKVIKTLSID